MSMLYPGVRAMVSRAAMIVLYGLLGAVFFGVAVENLLAHRAFADVERLAKLIETSPVKTRLASDYKFLDRFDGRIDFGALQSLCHDASSRALMTVRLARLEMSRIADDAAGDDRQAAAREAVEARLRCAPLDGNAWLHHARLLDDFAAPASSIRQSLLLSYRAAPAEAWIMIPRFAAVAPKIEAGDEALAALFHADLARLVEGLRPGVLAQLYVGAGPVVRAAMMAEIRKLPEERHRAIVSGVDALGVTVPRSR